MGGKKGGEIMEYLKRFEEDTITEDFRFNDEDFHPLPPLPPPYRSNIFFLSRAGASEKSADSDGEANQRGRRDFQD